MFTYEQYQESAAFLQKRLGEFQPELLLILGSGWAFWPVKWKGPWSFPMGRSPILPAPRRRIMPDGWCAARCRTPGDGDGRPLPYLRRL